MCPSRAINKATQVSLATQVIGTHRCVVVAIINKAAQVSHDQHFGGWLTTELISTPHLFIGLPVKKVNLGFMPTKTTNIVVSP